MSEATISAAAPVAPDPLHAHAHAESLREIIAGFERLEAMFDRGRDAIRPAKRGYFTPPADTGIAKGFHPRVRRGVGAIR